MSNKVTQEFYCGECKTYFMISLNVSLDYEALIACPSCAHEHRRYVNGGVVREDGRFRSDAKERIHPLKSTCSKEPLTEKMKEAHRKNSYSGRRDGVVVPSPICDREDRWLERAARDRGEIE